jgi:hypothetical protein
MEVKQMPSFRKPDSNVPMSKFMELVARVEALEELLKEKRGRKKAESEE